MASNVTIVISDSEEELFMEVEEEKPIVIVADKISSSLQGQCAFYMENEGDVESGNTSSEMKFDYHEHMVLKQCNTFQKIFPKPNSSSSSEKFGLNQKSPEIDLKLGMVRHNNLTHDYSPHSSAGCSECYRGPIQQCNSKLNNVKFPYRSDIGFAPSPMHIAQSKCSQTNSACSSVHNCCLSYSNYPCSACCPATQNKNLQNPYCIVKSFSDRWLNGTPNNNCIKYPNPMGVPVSISNNQTVYSRDSQQFCDKFQLREEPCSNKQNNHSGNTTLNCENCNRKRFSQQINQLPRFNTVPTHIFNSRIRNDIESNVLPAAYIDPRAEDLRFNNVIIPSPVDGIKQINGDESENLLITDGLIPSSPLRVRNQFRTEISAAPSLSTVKPIHPKNILLKNVIAIRNKPILAGEVALTSYRTFQNSVKNTTSPIAKPDFSNQINLTQSAFQMDRNSKVSTDFRQQNKNICMDNGCQTKITRANPKTSSEQIDMSKSENVLIIDSLNHSDPLDVGELVNQCRTEVTAASSSTIVKAIHDKNILSSHIAAPKTKPTRQEAIMKYSSFQNSGENTTLAINKLALPNEVTLTQRQFQSMDNTSSVTTDSSQQIKSISSDSECQIKIISCVGNFDFNQQNGISSKTKMNNDVGVANEKISQIFNTMPERNKRQQTECNKRSYKKIIRKQCPHKVSKKKNLEEHDDSEDKKIKLISLKKCLPNMVWSKHINEKTILNKAFNFICEIIAKTKLNETCITELKHANNELAKNMLQLQQEISDCNCDSPSTVSSSSSDILFL